MNELLAQKRNSFKQFVFFKILLNIIDLMVWGYYGILLLKNTDSIREIALNFILFYVFIWIGHVLSSFLLDRLGYLKIFKLSFGVQAITLLFMTLYLPEISNYFLIFSALRGFARGLFWPAHDNFYLKEVLPKERTEVISFNQSLVSLTNVVIPISAGALISFTESYLYVFLFTILICLVGVIFPFDDTLKSNSNIKSREITRILRKKLFWKFAAICFLDNAASQTLGMIMSFVPFYIIGTEFGVGALLSFVGLCSAITSYLYRKDLLDKKIKIAYYSWGIYSLVYIALSIFWNIYFLIIRSIWINIIFITGEATKIDLDIRIREKILGDFKMESAVEMNLVVETVYLFARITSLAIFILIMDRFKGDTIDLLRITVVILSLIMYITFHLVVKLYHEKLI